MAADKKQIIKSYFELPYIGDHLDLKKLDMADLWERLKTWLPRWLDELGDQLSDTPKISASKERALKRLRPLVEDALKKKFPVLADEDINDSQPGGKAVMKTAAVSTAAKKPHVSRDKATPVKPKKSAPKKMGGINTGAKIKVLAKENPRRVGTHGHKVFESYKRCKTVQEALDKGAKIADINWDVDHKYISLH